MTTLPASSAGKRRRPGWRGVIPGEEGLALVVAMLMLIVLSAIGVMAIYSSGIEYTMDVAFRNRGLSRMAAETGVGIVLDKVMYSASTFMVSEAIPSAAPVSGDTTPYALGKTRTHKSIGYCTVIDADCANLGQASDNTMCCFRLGPFFDRSANTVFRPTASGDLTDARLTIPIPYKLTIPGTMDYQYLLYSFAVTGGGPGGSASEFQVGVKRGPIPRAGGSGTQYGSVTGVNLN